MSRNGIRFLGHPLHALLVHFPIALWSVSVLWDILGLVLGGVQWWAFSRWSIAVGLGVAVIAAGTGLVDSMSVNRDGPEDKLLMRHMYVILVAFALYLGSYLVRLGSPVLHGEHLYLALSLSWIGFITLTVGGWYGGELVYRFAVGGSSRK